MASNKELKDVVIFVCSAANALSDALEDNQISLKDIKVIFPLLSKGARAMGGASDMLEEIRDLDPTEIADLVKAAQEALDLDDDELEAKIEHAFDYANDLMQIYELIKDALPS